MRFGIVSLCKLFIFLRYSLLYFRCVAYDYSSFTVVAPPILKRVICIVVKVLCIGIYHRFTGYVCTSAFAAYDIIFFYMEDICHGFQNVVKPYRIGQSRLMAACDLVVFSGYLIMDFKYDSFSDGSYLVYGAFARVTCLVKQDYDVGLLFCISPVKACIPVHG